MGQVTVFPDCAELGLSPNHVGRERPNPGSFWSKLSRGTTAQESTGPSSSPRPGVGRRRTDSRGEQSFEAGVTAVSTGESRRARDRTDGRRTPVRRCGSPSASAGNHRHGSAVTCQTPGLTNWQTSRRVGESGREAPECVAPAAVDHEPARKQEVRESGHGSPGRESSVGRLPGTRAA